MKVPARLSTLFVSAVSQSMSVDLMEKVARTVIPDYDVHERSGFPSNIPMPRADAARHILKDFTREGYFLKLIEALIDVTSCGDMGRDVRIPILSRIVSEVESQGYSYSREKGVFIEAGAAAHTMEWGTLREGRSYEFALLRVDLAGPCPFLASAQESGGDMIRRVEMLESVYTAPGSLTVSPAPPERAKT